MWSTEKKTSSANSVTYYRRKFQNTFKLYWQVYKPTNVSYIFMYDTFVGLWTSPNVFIAMYS